MHSLSLSILSLSLSLSLLLSSQIFFFPSFLLNRPSYRFPFFFLLFSNKNLYEIHSFYLFLTHCLSSPCCQGRWNPWPRYGYPHAIQQWYSERPWKAWWSWYLVNWFIKEKEGVHWQLSYLGTVDRIWRTLLVMIVKVFQPTRPLSTAWLVPW